MGSSLDSFVYLKDHCVERVWGGEDQDWRKGKERKGGVESRRWSHRAGWLTRDGGGGDDVAISQVTVPALNPSMASFN